jgi:hypothetical protein
MGLLVQIMLTLMVLLAGQAHMLQVAVQVLVGTLYYKMAALAYQILGLVLLCLMAVAVLEVTPAAGVQQQPVAAFRMAVAVHLIQAGALAEVQLMAIMDLAAVA